MHAQETELTAFIEGNKQFQIPVYQRKYRWSSKNCDTLWDDILRTGKNDKIQNHFIGSIVYVLSTDYQATGISQLTVIDGQQRLTTISLLLYALSKRIEKNYKGKLLTPQKIQKQWLSNSEETDDNLKRKLVLNETDNDTLNNILDDIQLLEPYSRNIKDNYEYFVKELEQLTTDEEINHIIMGIRKLKVVYITLKAGEDDPQLIFESLNATGMALSQTDLIRNFLLMGLEKQIQEDLYKNYWQPMEKMITSTNFDKFMKDFLTMMRTDIPIEREVYVTYKAYFYDRDENNTSDKCVKDLLYYAKFYEIIALLNTSDKEIYDAVNSISTRALRVSVAYPFLLRIFSDLDKKIILKDDVLEIMNLIQSYIFRRQICGLGTSGHARIFASLYGRIIDTTDRKTYVESVKAVLRTQPHKQRFPTNNEFFDKILSADVYNNKSCGYMLMKLENFRRKKEKVGVLGVVPEGIVTIEHILPQNRELSQEWRAELPADWRNVQERCVDKLGNLTITELNSELSDKSFQKKRKEAYDNTIYHLSSGLKHEEHWSETEITTRTEELAKLSLDIWKYPDVSDEILEQFKEQDVEISDEDDEGETWEDARNTTLSEIRNLQDKLIKKIKEKFPCYSEPHPGMPLLNFYTKHPLEFRNKFMVMECLRGSFNVSYRINPNTYTEKDDLKDKDGEPKIKKSSWYFRNNQKVGLVDRSMKVFDEDIPLVLEELEHAYKITMEELNYKKKS